METVLFSFLFPLLFASCLRRIRDTSIEVLFRFPDHVAVVVVTVLLSPVDHRRRLLSFVSFPTPTSPAYVAGGGGDAKLTKIFITLVESRASTVLSLVLPRPRRAAAIFYLLWQRFGAFQGYYNSRAAAAASPPSLSLVGVGKAIGHATTVTLAGIIHGHPPSL